jgi:hypothetical protein
MSSYDLAHSLPHPEELAWLGFRILGHDPRYPSAWMYRRLARDAGSRSR